MVYPTRSFLSLFWKILGFSGILSFIYVHSSLPTMEPSVKQNSAAAEASVDLCPNALMRKHSFPNNPECFNYTTRLCEESTFNLTALVSYPGSGNTWVRHLIEISTGYFTGSIYFDESLFGQGFLGEREEWSGGSTIVTKTHLKFTGGGGPTFSKGILIIRDPLAATKSFVSYLESGHTGWASPSTFKRKGWVPFLLHSVYDWVSLAESWIQSSSSSSSSLPPPPPPPPLLVLHYEDLVSSPKREVGRVLQFLNMSGARLDSDCFRRSVEGPFHRKPPRWKLAEGELSPETYSLLRKGVDYLNGILISHAHAPIPTEKYPWY